MKFELPKQTFLIKTLDEYPLDYNKIFERLNYKVIWIKAYGLWANKEDEFFIETEEGFKQWINITELFNRYKTFMEGEYEQH